MTDSLDAQLATFAPRLLAHFGVPGLAVAVMRNGRWELATGWGYKDLAQGTAMTPHASFPAASVSKTFLAALVVAAAHDHRIRLDQPLDTTALNLDCTNPRGGTVPSLLNYLTHTSGLRTETVPGDWTADRPKLLHYLQATYAHARGHEYAGHGPLWTNTPASRYQYSNLGYATIAHWLETITARPYSQYLRDTLLAPLNLAASTWLDAPGAPPFGVRTQPATGYAGYRGICVPCIPIHTPAYPGLSLNTNVRDITRWLDALLRPGHSPIPAHLVSQLSTPRVTVHEPGQDDPMSYALGLELRAHNTPYQSLGHSGAYPYGFWVDARHYPAHGLTITAVQNLFPVNRLLTPTAHLATGRLVNYIARHMIQDTADRSHYPNQLPTPPRPPHDPDLAAYVAGLLLTDKLRGLLGSSHPLTPTQIATMTDNTRRLPTPPTVTQPTLDTTPRPIRTDFLTQAVNDLNHISPSIDATRAFFASDQTPYTLRVLGREIHESGIARRELPIPLAFFADREEQPSV
jgi:D-alanyl-D-alanine carboxypeptidase